MEVPGKVSSVVLVAADVTAHIIKVNLNSQALVDIILLYLPHEWYALVAMLVTVIIAAFTMDDGITLTMTSMVMYGLQGFYV